MGRRESDINHNIINESYTTITTTSTTSTTTSTITVSIIVSITVNEWVSELLYNTVPVIDAIRPRFDRVRESEGEVSQCNDDGGADSRGSFLLQHCEQQR